MVKLIFNYGTAILGALTLWWVFFFHLMPWLLKAYRKSVWRRRSYDRQLDELKEKPVERAD